MPSVTLYLIFTLGIFTISAQKQLTGVEKILDYLTQKYSGNKGKLSGHRTRHYDHQQRHKDVPNLTNIQTLNLYLKHNNLRNKERLENELQNYLKSQSDWDCKATGRCGCGGGRCGAPRADDGTVEDVAKLLSYLDEKLNKEQEDDRDRKDKKQKYDDDDENDGDFTLKRTRNKYDDLDVIFLEVPDAEGNRLINQLQHLGDDVKVVDLRNVDMKKLLGDRKDSEKFKDNVRTRVLLTPEDFALYYAEAKGQIVNSLFKYVTEKQPSTYLARLNRRQKEEINRLMSNQPKTRLPDAEIKSRIIRIVFGYLNEIKILPQSKDSNIYVPQSVYDGILRFTKSIYLRVKKASIFPLTAKQKERMLNKSETNIISKHSWRRSLPGQLQYGVPFNLNVQGLGQVNN